MDSSDRGELAERAAVVGCDQRGATSRPTAAEPNLTHSQHLTITIDYSNENTATTGFKALTAASEPQISVSAKCFDGVFLHSAESCCRSDDAQRIVW